MFLTRDLRNRLIALLMPQMGNDTREAHLQAALLGHPVLNRIDTDGANYEFTSHLVDRINQHCDPPDMIRLLEMVRGASHSPPPCV